MGKDLRTTSTEMKLHKLPKIDGTHWNMKNLQPFFPPLERLFKTETISNLSDYGIRLADEAQRVLDETHIQVKGKPVEIHRKTTMIVSPFKWMRGDYGVFGLPKPSDIAEDIQDTLQNPNAAGYVGAMASITLSESECVHFPKVYGVYVGLATKHTLDISDDYEDLSERKWFEDNIGKTFELKLRSAEPATEFRHTRSQRLGVHLGEEVTLDGIQEIDAEHMSTPSTRSHVSSHASGGEDSTFTEESNAEDDDEFDIRSCDCSDTSEDEGLDDEGDDESFAWATFKDVPVITTVMEKCNGTFYDLIEEHTEPEKHSAWIAQILFALAHVQRNFGFVHNDLHGNNVMYVPTEKEYLYYKHSGTCYRIPTYGYIMKIIDFDRAAFSLRLCGMKDPRQFISSQFRPNEEAAGQYNVEPFYNEHHPRIAPNPSFDLCRFATSIFWELFPEGPMHTYTHPLFAAFKEWMTQTDGTSVLFRTQKPDRHDRYHGFDLYKAIARYCKESAVPRREIGKLSVFQVPAVPVGQSCLYVES